MPEKRQVQTLPTVNSTTTHVPLKSALLPSLTAAREEGGGGEGRVQDDPPLIRWSTVALLEPSTGLWSADGGGRSCGRSGWLLGSPQQEETQQVQHHQDQHQPNENLLHPQTRVQLLLQP